MVTITEQESVQIEAANASDRTPVVFIHGLWLLASSWEAWAEAFEAAGYASVCVSWPGDPATVEEARRDPRALAGKGVGDVADHVAEVIGALERKPAIVGHSFGGLLAQILAARGLAAATVAINPAPFRGILAMPLAAIRSTFPVLANPANRGRAVTLTFDQFRYSWANGPSHAEARRIYERFHVAAPGKPIFQAAVENLNPASELRVDVRAPARGPLLIFTGGIDHAVPPAMSRAAFKKQRRNPSSTEHVELPDRGHSLTIDDGWHEVSDATLEFLHRSLPA
ncbi:MAG TPA: alpha/beta hydrolase [Solirubrobacterales bacterium]|nr:alpha/beta hydrolase [Solirubrobacterales bacterium]